MSINVHCLFNGCHNVALSSGKCEAHKTRTRCMVASCHNQTYARNLCVKHGGKQKCIADNCTANARSHGLCCKHGPKSMKTLCEVDGCTKVAHARRRCVRHGGGRVCKVESCAAYARSAGLCCRHSYVQTEATLTNTVEKKPEVFDEWVVLLEETSILHVNDLNVAPNDCEGYYCSTDGKKDVVAEFSSDDCDWLEFLISDLVC
ncbi:hypothetical protein H257_07095 [Aphanomyces astaci]|uniref:WRKY transcription factor 19 n=1 Tax=Aphanomyces astaci TaxID=112090 RepID=W4GLG6_APHAT|nr:hypothetical protein H257_07095 [Aphanomyces astaci]ETV79884.1 hypothetical protein H257_07095 [Aphanomyces astaci]|eukprot:XP_009830820.1 hypothetical protein H257_07095 [Aphanomyces astaci]